MARGKIKDINSILADQEFTCNDYTSIQLAFAEEYLSNGDVFKSAIRVGYSEAKAKSMEKSFHMVEKIVHYIELNKRVEKELLNTWQPIAVIAERSGVSVRVALRVMVNLYNLGRVKMSYSRIDGHNKVHMFKKIETQTIVGVVMPVETEGLEL